MQTLEQPSNQLITVIESSGLETSTADILRNAFAESFEKAAKWKAQALALVVTDVSQTREMKLARESRLALREIRLEVESTRKKLKEDSLRMGKAIDGAANVLKFLIEPIEEHLLEQEKFAERAEAKRISDLREHRRELLAPYSIPSFGQVDLGTLPDGDFSAMLEDAKSLHQARIERERKAEEERIAREKAEDEERERIRQENERLKKEVAEREAAAKLEREKVEAERRAAEEAARKEREAQQAKLLEIERKAKAEREEADKKAAAERAKLEAAAKAEREAREKLEREAAAKRAAEEAKAKAEKDAAKRAAKAPDKDKLVTFASEVRSLKVPVLTTEEGKSAQSLLAEQIEKFATWIEGQAAKL